MIRLDQAAHAELSPRVFNTIVKVLKYHNGNPSSKHDMGKDAKRILDESREKVARFINAEPDEIFFCPSGCAANTLALNVQYDEDWSIISTQTEHKSIYENDSVWEAIKVDKNGLVRDFEDLLKVSSVYQDKYPRYFSIIYANNETGTVQNIKRLADIVHEHKGFRIHTDATQYIPHQRVDVKDLGVDALTFSGHKLGCPAGIAVAYIKKDFQKHIYPLVWGSQEQGLFGGTENIAYIAGLATAVEEVEEEYCRDYSDIGNWFVSKLLEIPDTYRIGGDPRIPIASICFKGVEANTLTLMLNDLGVFVSTGSACNSVSLDASSTILAMGVPEEEAHCVVRFSGYDKVSKETLNTVVMKVSSTVNMLRNLANNR